MLRFYSSSKKSSQITARTPTFPCSCLLCSRSSPDDENECARSGAGQGMQSKEMTTRNKSSGAAGTAETWHMTADTPGSRRTSPAREGAKMKPVILWVCNLRAAIQEQYKGHVMLNELSRLLLLSSFPIFIIRPHFLWEKVCILQIRLEATAPVCKPWCPWGGTSDTNWADPGLNIASS